jgi:peptide/nickel transport system substrate-binding protein
MSHSRRTVAIILSLALLIAALLTGCNVADPAPAPAPTATPESPTATTAPVAESPTDVPPTPTPSIPQGGSLTIRLAGDVPNLKPWDLRSRDEEIVADLLYNGLVRLDPALRPRPDLAERWEIAADGQTITFTLRSGVQWHDGEPLTAEDVAWTLNTLRTIAPSNALLFSLRSTIAQVRSADATTVVITLTQPHAPLLAELTLPILPRHRLQNRTPEEIAELNLWNEPIGSGPFKLDTRTPGESIALLRNETYFRGAPNLEQIALVVAPDASVTRTALDDGRLLLAEFADGSQSAPDDSPALRGGTYPENGWYGVVFNTREDRLFADRRLREALARAVDVAAIVAEVAGDRGEPIASTISRIAWPYPNNLDLPAPDPEAARQLLDEAGWAPGEDGVRQRDGQRLTARLWVRGDDSRRVAAAERIAAAAAEIGMELEVTPANFDTVILAKLAPPYDFDLLLGSWVNAPNSAGFPTNRFYDPDDFALFHSSRVWQGQGDARTGLRNVGGFSNAEYDAAAEEARLAYDPDARAQAIARSQEVLRSELPYLLLWTDRVSVVINARVGSANGPIAIDSPRYLWNVESWYLQP